MLILATWLTKAHPVSCSFFLVMLVSWKQEGSMMLFSPWWCLSPSLSSLGSLPGVPQRDTFNLFTQVNQIPCCCHLESFRWWWGEVPAHSKQRKPPHSSTCSKPHKSFLFALCNGKAFGEDGMAAAGRVPLKHMGWRNGAGSICTVALSRLQPSKSKGEAGEKRSRLLQTALGGALFPCLTSPLPQSCGLHLFLFFMWKHCFQSHQRGWVEQPCSCCQHAVPTCNSAAFDKVGNPEGTRVALAGLFSPCMQTASVSAGEGVKEEEAGERAGKRCKLIRRQHPVPVMFNISPFLLVESTPDPLGKSATSFGPNAPKSNTSRAL